MLIIIKLPIKPIITEISPNADIIVNIFSTNLDSLASIDTDEQIPPIKKTKQPNTIINTNIFSISILFKC